MTAVLSLGLGIGANIASFSLADAFLFRPLPVERPSEVVAINGRTSQESLQGVSYPDLRDLREKSRSFTDVIGYKLTRFAFARVPDAVPQMRMGMEVSQDFFAVLGLRPPVGRTFAHDECAVPGRDPVALLGYDFWQEQFGGDPSAVGATLRLNGVPFRIIGVTPREFTGMDPVIRPALFIPLTMAARPDPSGGNNLFEDRSDRALNLRARLGPGVSIGRAQAELSALSQAFARAYPEADRDRILRARTELQLRIEQAPPLAVLVLMVSVLSILVLAIACADARASSRAAPSPPQMRPVRGAWQWSTRSSPRATGADGTRLDAASAWAPANRGSRSWESPARPAIRRLQRRRSPIYTCRSRRTPRAAW